MHIHWWLFVLAFLLGMVLTTALMVRPVKSQTPEPTSSGIPEAESGTDVEPSEADALPAEEYSAETEYVTEKISIADDYPTEKISVAKKSVAQEVPAAAEKSPSKKVPVTKESPTQNIPIAKESPTQKIPAVKETAPQKRSAVKEHPTVKTPKLPFAPFGPGSARATADGGGPAGWLVKGRSDTRLYYTPDDAPYDSMVAQIWFQDEDSAVRAHFTAWRTSSQR